MRYNQQTYWLIGASTDAVDMSVSIASSRKRMVSSWANQNCSRRLTTFIHSEGGKERKRTIRRKLLLVVLCTSNSPIDCAFVCYCVQNLECALSRVPQSCMKGRARTLESRQHSRLCARVGGKASRFMRSHVCVHYFKPSSENEA